MIRLPGSTPEENAAWAEHLRRLPPYTRNTLGTAAEHILNGDITTAQLDAIIAGCHWCQIRLQGCPSECWHRAAKVLFAHGLNDHPTPGVKQ